MEGNYLPCLLFHFVFESVMKSGICVGKGVKGLIFINFEEANDWPGVLLCV